MIKCPHWKDLGSPENGECRLGYFDGRPAQRACQYVCELGRRGDPRRGNPAPPPPAGAGTELKKLLHSFGVIASPTCKCNAMAARMDYEGVDWCEAHLAEIVAVMTEEAEKRGWLRFVPFKELGAEMLVRKAIANAKDSQK